MLSIAEASQIMQPQIPEFCAYKKVFYPNLAQNPNVAAGAGEPIPSEALTLDKGFT